VDEETKMSDKYDKIHWETCEKSHDLTHHECWNIINSFHHQHAKRANISECYVKTYEESFASNHVNKQSSKTSDHWLTKLRPLDTSHAPMSWLKECAP
jgi:hypothetical protein